MTVDGQRIIIAGGGIAGIACALRLAEAGVAVTLLETRRKLGGRATSFVDVRTGETLDNCQHVALGCCTNYLDLIHRLGCDDKIEWHRTQHWVEPGGRISTIRPGALPAPLHFASSLLRASFLTLRESMAVGRAIRAIARADRRAQRHRTFGDFLRSNGQSDAVIRKFWTPIIVSACNLGVDRVSAEPALHVFQEGFLAHKNSADIGLARVPLVDLYDRAESSITAAGGEVRLGVSVDRIGSDFVEVTSGTDRSRLSASAVVCALPPERAAAVIDDSLIAIDPRFAALDKIEHSPILGVHIRFDRPVLPLPHAVLVDGGVQWLFRKNESGAALHAVISAAHDWVPLTESQIAERVVGDIQTYFPDSVGASVLWLRAIKEKRATFAPTPQVQDLRPLATGPSALILAGDYTDTGWPATMEGAARSGYSAAAAVLNKPLDSLLAAPLPTARLARLLGVK